jgi:uroporphyrin-3 C-methyltransferase
VNIDSSEVGSDPAEPAVEAEKKKDRKKGGGGALAFFALLTALAAAAGTAWMWWQDQAAERFEGDRLDVEIARLASQDSRFSDQLRELRAELESRPAGVGAEQVDELRGHLSEDRARVEALQQGLQEQVALTQSLQMSADAMHARLLTAEAALAEAAVRELDARGALDLAEVEYLLRLANERLQLFGDRSGADRALSLAGAHLAALDNPAHLGVRQAIAAARQSLAAIDVPDDLAISGELTALQEALPTLPFRNAAPAAVTDEAQAEGWWDKLKSTFASLVTVRRSTEAENQRISLEDQDYIRQRIWLQVEVARLALMRRDEEMFRGALAEAQANLLDWFDDSSPAVQSMLSSLGALQGRTVRVTWPDISAPWTLLQRVTSSPALPAATPSRAPAAEQPEAAPPEAEPVAPEAGGEEPQ